MMSDWISLRLFVASRRQVDGLFVLLLFLLFARRLLGILRGKGVLFYGFQSDFRLRGIFFWFLERSKRSYIGLKGAFLQLFSLLFLTLPGILLLPSHALQNEQLLYCYLTLTQTETHLISLKKLLYFLASTFTMTLCEFVRREQSLWVKAKGLRGNLRTIFTQPFFIEMSKLIENGTVLRGSEVLTGFFCSHHDPHEFF
jgi:hypothetical protein